MWAGFGAAVGVLIALDLPWVIINTKYGVYRGHVNGTVKQPAVVGAIWLCILIAEALLLSYLSSTAHKWWSALLASMFVGLVVYGTFNGTSLVTFDTWSWQLAGIDTAWGVLLLGLAGVAAYFAGRTNRSPPYETD
jgi:uncharacterized membrane protein